MATFWRGCETTKQQACGREIRHTACDLGYQHKTWMSFFLKNILREFWDQKRSAIWVSAFQELIPLKIFQNFHWQFSMFVGEKWWEPNSRWIRWKLGTSEVGAADQYGLPRSTLQHPGSTDGQRWREPGAYQPYQQPSLGEMGGDGRRWKEQKSDAKKHLEMVEQNVSGWIQLQFWPSETARWSSIILKMYCCQRIALETSCLARFQNGRPWWKAISLHLSNKQSAAKANNQDLNE